MAQERDERIVARRDLHCIDDRAEKPCAFHIQRRRNESETRLPCGIAQAKISVLAQFKPFHPFVAGRICWADEKVRLGCLEFYGVGTGLGG